MAIDDSGEGPDSGALSAVGVPAYDERVYRALLAAGAATPTELAELSDSTPDRADRALHRLRQRGLVSRLSGRAKRYTAAEPDAAIEALVRARTAELDEVRATAVSLSSVFHSTRYAQALTGTIEVLDGPQDLGRWFVRMQHEVSEEMLVLDRPPYALAAANPVEPVSLAHGVTWRAVYTPEALEQPGAYEEIQGLAAAGEQSRVLDHLPMKLAIADRRVALLPLSLEVDVAMAVVVHESTLLDGLIDLFESYWSRAVPIGGPPLPEVSTENHALVSLLAGGLTDNAIARQLGWSTRTLRRRTAALFDELAASNRFQAGVQAVRRGWL
jgi:hypothetical protein